MTAAESAAKAITNIGTQTLAESGVEATSVLSKIGTQGGKFAGYFAKNWAKILGSMVGAGMGAGIAAIPEFIKAIANENGSDNPIGLFYPRSLGSAALA